MKSGINKTSLCCRQNKEERKNSWFNISPSVAHLSPGRLLVQPHPPGEQPGCVLLQPHRHPLQPGGLPAGVLGGPEPAADLPLPAQEEHGAARAPPAAQGEEEPGGGPLRPAQRLRGPSRGGLGLSRRAGGRRRPGDGDGGGGGGGGRGRGRRAQRVPGDAAGSVRPRPLERAFTQPGQPPEQRHRGLICRLIIHLFTVVGVSLLSRIDHVRGNLTQIVPSVITYLEMQCFYTV